MEKQRLFETCKAIYWAVESRVDIICIGRQPVSQGGETSGHEKLQMSLELARASEIAVFAPNTQHMSEALRSSSSIISILDNQRHSDWLGSNATEFLIPASLGPRNLKDEKSEERNRMSAGNDEVATALACALAASILCINILSKATPMRKNDLIRHAFQRLAKKKEKVVEMREIAEMISQVEDDEEDDAHVLETVQRLALNVFDMKPPHEPHEKQVAESTEDDDSEAFG
jgi:hypothetical protein